MKDARAIVVGLIVFSLLGCGAAPRPIRSDTGSPTTSPPANLTNEVDESTPGPEGDLEKPVTFYEKILGHKGLIALGVTPIVLSGVGIAAYKSWMSKTGRKWFDKERQDAPDTGSSPSSAGSEVESTVAPATPPPFEERIPREFYEALASKDTKKVNELLEKYAATTGLRIHDSHGVPLLVVLAAAPDFNENERINMLEKFTRAAGQWGLEETDATILIEPGKKVSINGGELLALLGDAEVFHAWLNSRGQRDSVGREILSALAIAPMEEDKLFSLLKRIVNTNTGIHPKLYERTGFYKGFAAMKRSRSFIENIATMTSYHASDVLDILESTHPEKVAIAEFMITLQDKRFPDKDYDVHRAREVLKYKATFAECLEAMVNRGQLENSDKERLLTALAQKRNITFPEARAEVVEALQEASRQTSEAQSRTQILKEAIRRHVERVRAVKGRS